MTCLHTGRHYCSVCVKLPGNIQACDSSTVAAIACVKYRLAIWEISSCHALCETQVTMQHATAEKHAGLCAELAMRRDLDTLSGNQHSCRCILSSQYCTDMYSILQHRGVCMHTILWYMCMMIFAVSEIV